MTRLGWVAGAFAAGVLVPAAVLVGFGFRALAQEEARLRGEQERAFEKLADRAAAEVAKLLRDREETESRRPFFEYQRFYNDPRAITSNVAVACSPLASFAPDALVDGHFELRANRAITTPLIGPDAPGLDAPRGEPERRRRFLETITEELGGRLLAPAQKPSDPGPIVREETFDRDFIEENRRSAEWAQQIARARRGDVASQQRLFEQQAVEFSRAQDRGRASPAVAVRYHAFRYLPAGSAALYAYRLVDVGGELRYQGFRIDRRELLEDVIPGILAQLPVENLLATCHPAGHSPAGALVRRLDDPLLGIEIALRERDPRRIAARLAPLRTGLYLASPALLVMIAAGFVVIGRLVHFEIDLARKKSDFVSAVTHELKTPLSAIRMYGELLEEGWVKDRETERAYVATITRESERLSRLIDNVLDYARIEQRRKEFRFEDGDLGEAVRRTCDVLRPHVEGAGFALRVDVEEALPRRRFDRDAVAQILVNLVDNAVKYGRDASHKEIEVHARRDSGEAIVVEVRDHGPGIPPEDRERVFDQFHRCGSDLTRETRGVGLGLALVRGFARAQGGEVSIVESDGGGTCVRVRL